MTREELDALKPIYAWGQPGVDNARCEIHWWEKDRLAGRITWLKAEIKKLKKEKKQLEMQPYREWEDNRRLETLNFDLPRIEENLKQAQEYLNIPLPDRELTDDEKMNLHHAIENALRESVHITGKTLGYNAPPDSEIGRRILAVRQEMREIQQLILPEAAKDQTDRPDPNSSWQTHRTPASLWRRATHRDCRHCGSLCDVQRWGWNKTADELVAEDDAKNAEIRARVEAREAEARDHQPLPSSIPPLGQL